jgi:hypothetical protein
VDRAVKYLMVSWPYAMLAQRLSLITIPCSQGVNVTANAGTYGEIPPHTRPDSLCSHLELPQCIQKLIHHYMKRSRVLNQIRACLPLDVQSCWREMYFFGEQQTDRWGAKDKGPNVQRGEHVATCPSCTLSCTSKEKRHVKGR